MYESPGSQFLRTTTGIQSGPDAFDESRFVMTFLTDQPNFFTDQPNLSVNSGVHASLHPNCHHQIVHSSFNLNIYYPLPYQRLIWDYKKADANIIKKALNSVNWERLFDSKNINEQVIALNETLLNVF